MKNCSGLFFLCVGFLLCASSCGKTASTPAAVSQTYTVTAAPEETTTLVEIYLPILDRQSIGARAYVAALQEENPEMGYLYYNEDYYIVSITWDDRAAMLDYMRGIENPFAVQITAVAIYSTIFIGADISEDGKTVTFIVDSDAYIENSTAASYYAYYMGSSYSLRLQAYMLVPLNERTATVRCVDADGNILMDMA